jgi:hypothetical protein
MSVSSRSDLVGAERGCNCGGGGHDLLVVGDELHTGMFRDGNVGGVVGRQPVGSPPSNAQQLRFEHFDAELFKRDGELLKLSLRPTPASGGYVHQLKPEQLRRDDT